MKNMLDWLKRSRAPQKAVAELAELTMLVSDLAGRVGNVAAGIVFFETLLEHKGILTPETIEECKPAFLEKLGKPAAGECPKPPMIEAAGEGTNPPIPLVQEVCCEFGKVNDNPHVCKE